MILTPHWRRRLATACLLVLAAWSANHFHWRSLSWRWPGAIEFNGLSPEQRRAKGTGFGFDPDYAVFLDAVRRATPPDATVCVIAPRPGTHASYVYQAVFTLLPRRVVGPGEAAVVPFIAFYDDDRALALPGSSRIARGVLIRR